MYPSNDGLSQKNNAPGHRIEVAQNLFEEHSGKFRVCNINQVVSIDSLFLQNKFLKVEAISPLA